MALWTGIISGAFGGAVALVQGIVEKKQETNRIKIEKELENKKFEIEQNTLLEISKNNIDIEKYKSIVSLNEANKVLYEKEKQEYSDFTNSGIQLTKVDFNGNTNLDVFLRFSTGFVRPFATYSFLIINGVLAYFNKDNAIFLELFYIQLDYMLAFWFVRRSYDKQQISNIFQKKNLDFQKR